MNCDQEISIEEAKKIYPEINWLLVEAGIDIASSKVTGMTTEEFQMFNTLPESAKILMTSTRLEVKFIGFSYECNREESGFEIDEEKASDLIFTIYKTIKKVKSKKIFVIKLINENAIVEMMPWKSTLYKIKT